MMKLEVKGCCTTSTSYITNKHLASNQDWNLCNY